MRRGRLLAIQILAVTAVLAMALPGVAIAGRYPYDAEVAADGAAARSGPGDDFYPTSKLAAGERVQVYHETPAGWCAIRPPADSFSWVAAKNVKLRDTSAYALAEVVADKSPAFIGSRVSADRDAVAVRLKRGERVTVLGRQKAGGQTWIKIAPPSGEFRWIETKLLRTPQLRRAVASPGEPPAKLEPLPEGEEATDIAGLPELRSANADDQTASDDASTNAPAKRPSVRPSSYADPGDGDPGDGESKPAADSNVAKPAAKNGDSKSTTVSEKSPAARKEFWRQLQALDLELSLMAAKDSRQWRFDDIRRDAQTLYNDAVTDEEYEVARHLLGKIARFESARRERADLDERVARSRKATSASPNATANATPNRTIGRGASPAPNAAGRPLAAATSPAQPAADNRYDASGKLVAVQSRRPGTPPYAIVDDRNQVRTYISPAPRVNLQAYVGRVVGISGVASPAQDQGREHVVAQRIAVLDGPVRK